ncbi:putative GNAT superfamily acetyltransferase [Murinocardiopsis flavida]|uniref:Putative GNAT superfamily acetyltransferase n=1 Tax=Murinocardiopsis flavida TaxID=645275 RepID=A0A2P8CVC5_9ACTN|nr:GNAT family N-acetyltransferase [Murinocardiopsis flavida]PSK88918.1 putative GNAT superfamily acetyltransferase [Murinocardiopsis flavida]
MQPLGEIVVSPIGTPEDLRSADALYRLVFRYEDPAHGVNPRLMRSLLAYGGSVVGAKGPDGDLVAFAFGFLGTDGGRPFHYSQTAVVHPRHQGRGLGRALKLAQRDVALEWGTTTMRWCFDPALARNAHFNLDVLGAAGRWFHRDFFGPGTDRMFVEWELSRTPGPRAADSEPPAAARPAAAWAEPVESADGVWLPLPADIGALAADEAREVRAGLSDALERLTAAGHAAVSCRRLSEHTSAYLLRADAPGGGGR